VVDRSGDGGDDGGDVVEHGVVAKSKHSKSFVLERDRSLCVFFGAQVVNIPIELDHQARARDVEVDDPPSNHVLTANSTAKSLAAKSAPETTLRRCRVSTELLRHRDLATNCTSPSSHHASPRHRAIRTTRGTIEPTEALAEQGPTESTYQTISRPSQRQAAAPAVPGGGGARGSAGGGFSTAPTVVALTRGARQRGWGLQHCANRRCSHSGRAAARVGALALRQTSFCPLGARGSAGGGCAFGAVALHALHALCTLGGRLAAPRPASFCSIGGCEAALRRSRYTRIFTHITWVAKMLDLWP